LQKIFRQKSKAEGIPHPQQRHVFVFKNHGKNPAQFCLHVRLGVGVGFIDQQIGDTRHAEVGRHALVVQKRRSLQNGRSALVQVAVESLRRQRHGTNQAHRAGDLVEIERRTDVSIDRQELKQAETGHQRIDERKSNRSQTPRR
jgi:hypothetical protein